ncbi:MAG: 30S ribosomal protein S21 [Chloroflexota bacterium]
MQVVARDNESFEELLHRFKRGVMKAGLLKDMKSKRHFISKGELRREKMRAAERKRRQKAARAKGPKGAR